MKLSTAILKGCEKFPRKCKRVYTRDNAACVLGAAMAGVGRNPERTIPSDVFPALDGPTLPSLPDIEDAICLHEQLVLINDFTRWSREHIAEVLREAGL